MSRIDKSGRREPSVITALGRIQQELEAMPASGVPQRRTKGCRPETDGLTIDPHDHARRHRLVIGILLLGFLIDMRHASGTDHVARGRDPDDRQRLDRAVHQERRGLGSELHRGPLCRWFHVLLLDAVASKRDAVA